MKVLIVNPIIYTSETRQIKKAETIKDTMIYDLCLAFLQEGAEVVLAVAEDYMPNISEQYPFEVVALKTKLKKVFPANALPFCPEIIKTVKSTHFDLIITSEVFSLNSLMLAVSTPKNLIVWHELAKHNRIMKKIPSILWYNIVARLFFGKTLIVPRSIEARDFISNYIPKKNISDKIIDHGVNLDKFKAQEKKNNFFIVSSQLISRKRIDTILKNFSEYLEKYDKDCRLFILGDGEERKNLELLSKELHIEKNVLFKGRLPHEELKDDLASAMAMLVNTRKDNNMVSVVESIACGTPVITSTIPYNASYINSHELGIAKDNWNADDMRRVAEDSKYIKNCIAYRQTLSCTKRAQTFLDMADKRNHRKEVL